MLKDALYRAIQNGGAPLELGGGVRLACRSMAGDGICAALRGTGYGATDLEISVTSSDGTITVGICWTQPADVNDVDALPDVLTRAVVGIAEQLETQRCSPALVEATVSAAPQLAGV